MTTPAAEARGPNVKAALGNVCLGLFCALMFTWGALSAPPGGPPQDYFGLFRATDRECRAALAALWWLMTATWVVRLVRPRRRRAP